MLSVINIFYNRLIEFITDAVPNVELQMNIFVISIVKQITTGVTDIMSGIVLPSTLNSWIRDKDVIYMAIKSPEMFPKTELAMQKWLTENV